MDPAYRIHASWRFIRYEEGADSLVLTVEPIMGLSETEAIIYVPTAERWKREMPEWARERREEILARIKADNSRGGSWEEY